MATYRVWCDATVGLHARYDGHYVDVNALTEDEAVRAARRWARKEHMTIERVLSVEMVAGGRADRFLSRLAEVALGGPTWKG